MYLPCALFRRANRPKQARNSNKPNINSYLTSTASWKTRKGGSSKSRSGNKHASCTRNFRRLLYWGWSGRHVSCGNSAGRDGGPQRAQLRYSSLEIPAVSDFHAQHVFNFTCGSRCRLAGLFDYSRWRWMCSDGSTLMIDISNTV